MTAAIHWLTGRKLAQFGLHAVNPSLRLNARYRRAAKIPCAKHARADLIFAFSYSGVNLCACLLEPAPIPISHEPS